MTLQCRNLQKENDEQKDLLSEAEQQEKSNKVALQKALKEKVLLEKKLESIQSHVNNFHTFINLFIYYKKFYL